MKDKKKGFQQSAIVTESLETPDFKPFQTCYLSFRDIKTTVSTWHERLSLMSGLYFSFCPSEGIGQ